MRKRCQKRWGALLKNEPAVKTAGMAASFLCIAEKKVKPGGRIGFVLPLSAAFDESWCQTREMFVREFDEIVAVATAGSSGGTDEMSADTKMGEMLLVGKRRSSPNKGRKAVLCVTLRRIPQHHGESAEFARSILRSPTPRSDEHAHVVAGTEELGVARGMALAGGEPWSDLGSMHEDVAYAANRLAATGALVDTAAGGKDMTLHTGMVVLSDIFAVGPTHHLIGSVLNSKSPSGAFDITPTTSHADERGRNRMLWAASSKNVTLIVRPTHKGAIADPDVLKRIKGKTGTLHYARGMRWTSQKILAATTSGPVFGGRAWTTLIHDDHRLRKAFAVWANSTLGMVVHWTQASRTQSGRGPIQVKGIHEMPVPDFRSIAEARLQAASDVFDELGRRPLMSACLAHADPVRTKFDEAVVAMFELPIRALAAVENLRELWCAEPSVHGGNRPAVALLIEKELL